MIRVHPYRKGSKSAGKLAMMLGYKVLRREGSLYSPRQGDTIINWGDSKCPYNNGTPARVLNNPSRLSLASNKLSAFRVLEQEGVKVPLFVTDRGAVSWTGLTVLRHKLTGHSGEGIEITENTDNLPQAPLYVQYVKKQDEYRVHLIGQRVILVQRKARRHDCENPDWQVRNHKNGFVFVRNEVTPPSSVLSEAQKAITALALDFGAVDVIWNEQEACAYVLEVNTAPGLEGQTIQDYADGFKEYLK